MSDDREILTWELFGEASRTLAQMVADDGFEPDMSLATRNVPDKLAANKYVRFGGKVGFGWLSNDFGPDGHIGDPTSSSAEHGAALFEAAVTAFAEGLAEIAAFDFGR